MSTSFSKSSYAHTTYSGADMLVTLNIKNTSQHKNVTHVLGELQTLSYSTHMERSGVRKLGNVNVSDFTNGPRTIAGSLVFAVFDRHVMRAVVDQMGTSEDILPDELPPFDITITYANEYGKDSVLRIYGVRLVNEGQVCSVNDIYMENTYQYVATNIQPLEKTSLSTYKSDQKKSDETSDSNNSNTLNQEDILSSQIEDMIDADNSSDADVSILPFPRLVIRQLEMQTSFDVTLKTEPLNLTITSGDTSEKKYLVAPENWPFKIWLEPGNYRASIKNQLNQIYNATSFTINNSKPAPPLITEITSNSIHGKVQQDVSSIVITDHKNYKNNFDLINSKSFDIYNLNPDTFYYIQSVNKTGTLSDIVTQKTLVNSTNMFFEFDNFIKTNNLSSDELDELTNLAKANYASSKDPDFLNAFYEAYINQKQKENNAESIMHLVSYFDLVYKQNIYHFNFKNKWLNQIEPNSLATNYKFYSENGVSVNTQQHSGITKHQQLFNMTLEKLNTYRVDQAYQKKLQQEYLTIANNYKSIRDIFNMRHSAFLINTNYGFYDDILYTKGAFIKIRDNMLSAHLNFTSFEEADVYFVFKEDICLDVSFKVKASSKNIKLDMLSFFNYDTNYIVYLEANNSSISKSIVIQNGICSYSYDSLYALSIRYKMQDIVHEICSHKNDAFEMFCDGLYLLVNRKQFNETYIKLFDEWLFGDAKYNSIKYVLENNSISFNQEVTLLYFDKHGEFIKTEKAHTAQKQTSGFLIWFTENHKMSVFNFENI